jgi:flagellar FliL protein
MATAEASPPADAPEAAAPAAARKGRSLLVVAIAVVVLLAGLGGGAWFLLPKLLHRAHPEPAEARPAPPPPVKATVSLGSVVVNIAGEGRRYLKISVDVGVADAREVKEVEERKPQILDLLITVLATKEVEELTSAEGRSALKDELLAGIREDVGLEKVSRVFFTEFVIQ